MRITLPLAGAAACAASLSLAAPSLAAPAVHQAAGATPAAIQPEVDAFRAALGTLNANTPGSRGTGRREINWDGVPAGESSPGSFNAKFFNANSPRGAVFSTPGQSVQVSGKAAGENNTPEFTNVNATYAADFAPFSPEKLFAPIGSNVTDTDFFVPGSQTERAGVSGFGAVFSDVDTAGATTIAAFDKEGELIGDFAAPVAPGSEGLSFLGITVGPGDRRIARVRITTGTAAIAAGVNDLSQGGTQDLVVMDDFIYGEPVALPGAPSVAFDAAALGSVDEGATAQVRITRSGDLDRAVKVAYATGGGTATPGQDYVPSGGTLTFGVGEASKAVPVTALPDAVRDADETVGLTLDPVGANVVAGPVTSATLTIRDQAPAPERVAPLLSGFLARTAIVRTGRGPRSAALRLLVSERATLTITARKLDGRGRGTVPGATVVTVNQGLATVRLTGRIAGRRLGAGRYAFSVVATDAAGNRSKAVRAVLRIR